MATVTKPIALDESFNTTELTPRNIADVLAEELSRITGRNASQVEYDNTESGLTADNVQDALDEIVEDIPTVPSVDIQTAVDEFETYNGGLLSSLKVSLTPNQDLHGYDSPWVGGANVNKFPSAVAESKTVNGVTVVSDGHGTYSFSGTASADTNIDFDIEQTYTIPQSIGNGGQGCCYFFNNKVFTNVQFMFYFLDGTRPIDSWSMNEVNRITSSYSAMSGQTCNRIRFAVFGGTNYDGFKISPMFSENGLTTNPFTWWKNICPISGHTQAVVGDDGKNKLPNEATSQTVNGVTFDINNDGSITLNNQSTADWTGITLTSAKFLKAGTYTVSCPRVNSVDTRLIISYDGAEKVNTYNVDYKTFTLSEDKIISVRFVIRNSGVSFSNVTYYPMIELGSTATPYVPYNGYQVTVNLGGTYYGGTLDVVTGVFTPDMASVDLGTLTWVKGSILYFAEISGIKIQTNLSQKMNAYCSSYKISAQSEQKYNTISGLNWGANIAFWNLVDYSDANQVKTAMSGVQLVYELATPTPIQLSPTMVKALVGENHLSAPLDGQEITESKYKQMFTFDDVIAYIQSLS